jgi:hypothetical protein
MNIALKILATLLEGNTSFQKIVGDLNAIDELCEIIKNTGAEKKDEDAKKSTVK